MKIKVNFKRFTAFIMILFTFYIFSMHYKAVVDAVNIKNETSKYESLISEEKSKNKKLKKKEQNLDSEKYYEDIARENLGLLKSNETLYVNADAK